MSDVDVIFVSSWATSPSPQTHSLPALRQLTLAMHAAVAGILDRPRGGKKKGGGEEEKEEEKMVYRVEGTAGIVTVFGVVMFTSTC